MEWEVDQGNRNMEATPTAEPVRRLRVEGGSFVPIRTKAVSAPRKLQKAKCAMLDPDLQEVVVGLILQPRKTASPLRFGGPTC